MVTAEAAVSLPALAAVAVALAWLLGLGASQAVVTQAAREGARAAARGESLGQVRSAVHSLVPGATVIVRRDASTVTVTATLIRTPPGNLPVWGSRALRASATSWREQS